MPMSTKKEGRHFIASRFVLKLDGDDGEVGTLQSVEGAAFKSAGVADEKIGKEGLVTRFSGRPQFEDVTIQVGMAVSKRFWQWLDASLKYNPIRKDGSILALDFDNKIRWERKFTGALITEIGFPALDGSSKDAAYLTVKFAVEHLEEVSSKQQKERAEQESKGEWEKQRLWLASNFTMKIDTFPDVNALTSKVDGFTIKQAIIDCPTGGFLETTKEPGRVDFPNLSVTIMQQDSGPWMDWYEKFVRHGDYGSNNEKTGHITYLARDVDKMKPLMTLDIFGMGITAISALKYDAKQEQVQKLKVDMYCESMSITPYDRGVV